MEDGGLIKKSVSSGAIIYIIDGGEFYKIGKTTRNPKNRLIELQVNCPFKLELKRYFKITKDNVCNSHRIENAIHKKLRGYKTHGEWFEKSPTLETAINKIFQILEEESIVKEEKIQKERSFSWGRWEERIEAIRV